MRYLLPLILLCGAANAETRIEVGPTLLSDEFSSGVSVSVIERTDKWDFGITWTSEQDVWPGWEKRNGYGPAHLERNAGVFVQRHWTLASVEEVYEIKIGIGVAYWANKNRALGSNLTFPVVLEIPTPLERWTIHFRHFSNAGSATPNLGQDMITIGYSF